MCQLEHAWRPGAAECKTDQGFYAGPEVGFPETRGTLLELRLARRLHRCWGLWASCLEFRDTRALRRIPFSLTREYELQDLQARLLLSLIASDSSVAGNFNARRSMEATTSKSLHFHVPGYQNREEIWNLATVHKASVRMKLSMSNEWSMMENKLSTDSYSSTIILSLRKDEWILSLTDPRLLLFMWDFNYFFRYLICRYRQSLHMLSTGCNSRIGPALFPSSCTLSKGLLHLC